MVRVRKSQYLPVSLVLIAIVYIIFGFLNKSKTGKWIYAIGGNPNAARASGINVNKILIIVYSLCGFLSGIGALILAGRTDSGYPNAGLQSELDAIAACIIEEQVLGERNCSRSFCWSNDNGYLKKWFKFNGC